MAGLSASRLLMPNLLILAPKPAALKTLLLYCPNPGDRSAICPSTRLHITLAQEILQHGRLNMKYRTGIVAFACLVFVVLCHLSVFVSLKDYFAATCLDFSLFVWFMKHVLSDSVLLFLVWILLLLVVVVVGGCSAKKKEAVRETEKRRANQRNREQGDNRLAWKWLL